MTGRQRAYGQLLGAVVEQAVTDVLRPLDSDADLMDQATALAWIADDGREPFSYLWACEAADIDPDIARRALRQKGYL